MSNLDMMEALQMLAAERGITIDTLLSALADALESAYKRREDAYEYAWVTIDPDTFEFRVFAQEIDEDGEPYGDEIDVTPSDFGRIAAQTAKQVMTQRLREIDREQKYEEYAGREGDIVTGIIQQNDSATRCSTSDGSRRCLPQAEQVPYERPEPGARVKAYIVEVRKTSKGPQIVVSRTHPGLIKRLFELEVPEIADGVVEIKACAASQATAPRSLCGRTTTTSTGRRVRRAPAARVCAWSSTSCAARRSTSSRSPTIRRLRDEGAVAREGQGSAHRRDERHG